ncbi:YiiX/YebB-like N1pC/P60 family cysteine hydrolase [Acidovorax sp. NCPPB 3576]|uniref:YiiX/YebB-like N1pC/P60 family cysteine hydrolase n=1 Tax=Acidovorax sp. NCPPB 3576 TaxID=2940488 RepID=UPI002349AB43|nr:YiiX/YebB-like N1pC/P60 family cysteine hydrolase [Acidovorax sp. NCPPB 3576]WCM87373.1 hypothetical protein M5C98_18760 [Acidovorax sp. NCPPB 3576]
MTHPNPKYIINIDSLRPGDIILTSAKTVISKSIRIATKSDFSHVIFHVRDGSCMHADSGGVHPLNLQRFLLDEKNTAVVLRLKNYDQFQNAIAFACDFVYVDAGKSYSTREALFSKKLRSSKMQQRENRQFCSRLVAQAYAAAGINLVNNPDYCFPSDFSDSELLEFVDECIELASDEQIAFAISDSPLDLQKHMMNEIMAFARRLFDADVQSFPQIELALEDKNLAKLEGMLAKKIEETGFLSFGFIDVEKNPWRYNGQILMTAVNISDTKKLEAARRELKLAKSDVKKYEALTIHHYYRYMSNGFKYDEQFFELYKKMHFLHSARKIAADYVIDLLGNC